MSLVKLPQTGIEFAVTNSVHYKDDGTVNNIANHTFELHKVYAPFVKQSMLDQIVNTPIINTIYRKLNLLFGGAESGGRTYTFYGDYNSLDNALKDGAEIYIHSYIMSGFNEYTTTFLKGHEETHILIDFNKLDLLKKELLLYGIDTKDLETQPEEVICNIGGFYAVLKNHPNEHYNIQVAGNDIQGMMNWLQKDGKWNFKTYK